VYCAQPLKKPKPRQSRKTCKRKAKEKTPVYLGLSQSKTNPPARPPKTQKSQQPTKQNPLSNKGERDKKTPRKRCKKERDKKKEKRLDFLDEAGILMMMMMMTMTDQEKEESRDFSVIDIPSSRDERDK